MKANQMKVEIMLVKMNREVGEGVQRWDLIFAKKFVNGRY